MERIVYFQDKSLVFSREEPSGDYYAVACTTPEAFSRAKVLKILETHNNVALLVDDPEQAFRCFAADFRWVEAAGGVVCDPRSGNILMMFRNQRWDLPKGHVEQGEAIAEAALREVGEETGIEARLVAPLCATLHAYYFPKSGCWELKQTHWFRMEACAGDLTPQTEEGIEQVEWVAPTELEERLTASYPTIRRVFAAYWQK